MTPVRSSTHSEAGNTIPEVIAQANFTHKQQERGLAVSSVQETFVMRLWDLGPLRDHQQFLNTMTLWGIETHNHPEVSWVCPGASFLLDIPETLHLGGVHASFRCRGAAAVL